MNFNDFGISRPCIKQTVAIPDIKNAKYPTTLNPQLSAIINEPPIAPRIAVASMMYRNQFIEYLLM